MSLKPTQSVPDLDLPLAGGGRFVLSKSEPAAFTMIVFYRGLHCPVCKKYLSELNDKANDFADAGVKPVAISADNVDRAGKAKSEWEIREVPIAHDMSIAAGREWGLFVSRAISDKEPAQFLEPGLFLIRPDRTLYAASIQTMPFARPSFGDILKGVHFVTSKNYSPRGEA